ncbi:MAG: ABC transporter substrate-binding protein [Planctomycetaceae bacterium]
MNEKTEHSPMCLSRTVCLSVEDMSKRLRRMSARCCRTADLLFSAISRLRFCAAIIVMLTLQLNALQTVAADERVVPPVFESSKDSVTGAVSMRFMICDIFIFSIPDGRILTADPGWTNHIAKAVRGTSLQTLLRGKKVRELRIAPFVTPADVRQYGPSRFKTVTYWETRATQEARRLIDRNEFEMAIRVLKKISEFNAQWKPREITRLVQETRLQQASDFLKRPESEEIGINIISQLLEVNPKLGGLQKVSTDTFMTQANSAYVSGRYEECISALKRITKYYASSAKPNQMLARLRTDSARAMSDAEDALKSGRSQRALNEAMKAIRMFPEPNDNLQKRAADIMRHFQVLTIAAYEKPTSFDPFHARLDTERHVGNLVFERIMEPSGNGVEFGPGPLVESYRQRAGFQNGMYAYDVTIRKGQKFSDGRPVTGSDIVQSLQLLRDEKSPVFDPEWARMVPKAELSRDSPFGVTIWTRESPNPLSLLAVSVLPKHLLPRVPSKTDRFCRDPVGTGPFRVSAPAFPVVAQVEANPSYREQNAGRPWLKQIRFHRYDKKGTGAAISDLVSGRIEMISDPSPIQLVRLKTSTGLVTRPFQTDSVWVLAINHRRSQLQDRRLRQAILLALGRQEILNRWFGAGGAGVAHTIVTGPFPAHSRAYDPGLQVRDKNTDQAKRIISSLPPVPELQILYAKGDNAVAGAMDSIRKDLAAAGLKVRLSPQLPQTMQKKVGMDHDFDIAYWEIKHTNVIFNLAGLFDPAATGRGRSNYTGYAPQRLVQLFGDLRNANLGPAVWTLQNQIHLHFYNELPVIPLWQLDSFVVHTDRLISKDDEGHDRDLPVDRNRLFREPQTWYLKPPTVIGRR